MTGCLAELRARPIEAWYSHHGEFEGAAPAAMEIAEAGGSWRGLARPGCGCQRNKQACTTMGDSGTCSRQLSAQLRLQADEARHGDAAGSARQGKHSAK